MLGESTKKYNQGYLYVIRNKVNGKEYVGKTETSVRNRYKNHWRDSIKEKNKDRPLYRAFRKYGPDSFEVEEIGRYPVNELDTREIQEIQKRGTYSNGYNGTLGGDGKKLYTVDPEEVYSIYRRTGSYSKTAEEIGCTYKTAVALLKCYDLNKHYKMKNLDGQFIPRTVQLKNGPVKITFDSINKASYFVESLLKQGMNRRYIGSSISRAVCGERKGYLKIEWTHLEEAS